MFAAADDAAIDRIVAELRVDGVVVEEPVGYGKAKVFHDRLVRLAAAQDFPTYVVLSDDLSYGPPAEGLDETVELLHRRMGEPRALIVVGNKYEGEVRLFGVHPDLDVQRSLSTSDAEAAVKERAHTNSLPAPLEAEIAVLSAAPALAAAERREEPGNPLDPSTVASLAAEAAELSGPEAQVPAEKEEPIVYATPAKTAFW